MKVGTLVQHPKWGKAVVLKNGNRFGWQADHPIVFVHFLNPSFTPRGFKVNNMTVSVEDLTILSEPEG